MNRHKQHDRKMERGQVTILVVMALSIFLLAFLGWATDYTNFWFHRQAAQGGADATCQAAAVDWYLVTLGTNSPNMNFTPKVGETLDCTQSPTAAPCIIAKYNGYDATLAGNTVTMRFTAAAPPGVTAPPDTSQFIQADVTKDVPAYFSRLLTGKQTVPVHAKAVCGLSSVLGPVPIIVLRPQDSTTLRMNGSSSQIKIVGGPPQSVQVNSSDSNAVTGNKAFVDLSNGGPDQTGSSFGTFGGQATQPGGVILGSTGKWEYPHLPISDPYAGYDEPSKPGNGTRTVGVPLGVNGCPDATGQGCTEYTAGSYDSGITVGNGSHETAIFDPGIYYVGGNGLQLNSNSIVRTSTALGDGSGGVMFFFYNAAGNSSVFISSNSGSPHGSFATCTTSPTNCIVQYHIDGSSEFGVASRALQCPGGAVPPPLPTPTIVGNVLLAPCTGTYGDPTPPPKNYRGFLFFQHRGIAVDGSAGNHPPQWQGGGSTLTAGFMYFHQCHVGSSSGTEPCDQPTGTGGGFGDVFNMGGTPGSSSYAVGSLITDEIVVGGTPNLTMILHPDKTFNQIKIGFFQ